MVDVKNLRKKYGSKIAVDNVSFTVNKGDIFGIMGPNGAGKSTILESILCTKIANSGEISVFGEKLFNKKELFNRIGVQFQESSYQGGIKVKEICEFTSSLYKNANNWVDKISWINLEDKLDSTVSSLSGGEKQKLSILLSTIHSPELLFLDELTTGLDPIARRETWEFIKSLNINNNTTIILTSHFMDEVEYLCNRGLILVDGKIKTYGTIDEIISSGFGKNLDESYINIVEGDK